MYTCCVYSSVMRKGENTLLDVKHHHILFPVKRLGQGVQASRLQYPIDQHSWRRAGRKTQRTLITSRASGRGWRASRSASTASPCGSLRSASSCTAASHRAAHLAVPRPRDGAMRRRSRSSRAGCSSACTCYTRASGRCHRAGRAKRRSRAAQSAPLQVVGGRTRATATSHEALDSTSAGALFARLAHHVNHHLVVEVVERVGVQVSEQQPEGGGRRLANLDDGAGLRLTAV